MQTNSLLRRASNPIPDLRAFAVDCAVIVGFVVLGLVSHDVNPIGDVLYTIDTVTPFLAGWLICSALIGLYRNRTSGTITTHLQSVTVCWLAAVNVAILIRGILRGGIVWPFPLVMTGLGLLALLGSRTAYDRRDLHDENRL